MSLHTKGQRCISLPEPELGLGILTSIETSRLGIDFPATGEKRIYAANASVLQRVQFNIGETIKTESGDTLVIVSIAEQSGLLVYTGQGKDVREDAISSRLSINSAQERLLKGQVDPSEVFDLRYKSLQAQATFKQSDVRGFLGGRIDLIPHQFYILKEVSSRQIPRVLLADEVGLGKTIEACLILQRLLAVGKASRSLILVPESLVHQWFVELLRRFNLWFSIFDESRCIASERSTPEGNPFLDEQLVLCSVSFLADNEIRRAQAIEAGWDILIVDEAHHLEWTPASTSSEYDTVEQLAQSTPGLLLLTATPTQLGLEGHFARLRLLDPSRYNDYDSFLKESEEYNLVAAVAGRIIEEEALSSDDLNALKRIFNKDPNGLERHLTALTQQKKGAREALLKALLDEHGTGRVIFRNTRANMSGFPKRKLCPVPLPEGDQTLQDRMRKELEAEATENESDIRYTFSADPRVDWLASFLRSHKNEKILLICKTQRKTLALEAALLEKIQVKIGLFHEGLPLVRRDRNAAWFSEQDGAQLLICSEIGSEGRNFQFAHHLVFMDLPLNPGLLEQRIGRLDRIGQTETIQIHVPYVKGSCQEFILEWYHRGLNAFEASTHSGNEYQAKFNDRLLSLALEPNSVNGCQKRDALIKETSRFRQELSHKLKNGRDRLLELNSFDSGVAEQVINQVREMDADPFLKNFIYELMEHFGVKIVEHEEGDVFLDPSHAYIEGFPSLPHEGALVTFERQRAITREDILFVSPDHPLLSDSLDLLINSPTGTASFCQVKSDEPNIVLEAIFMLETMAHSRWHVDQFLSPVPLRILVDILGNDLTDSRSPKNNAHSMKDGNIYRFLEKPGFNTDLLKRMVDEANTSANAKAQTLKNAALSKAKETLGMDIQRLIDLQKINDHVRDEEIDLAKEQLLENCEAIENARIRLDSIRLIVEGPA
ncbi:MAG: RNA polymerase-associated protein RapA [Opitutaceae bacterium]|nr:RNA polymerase-associated protein RapA [Opitutaceae bacterium]